MTKSVCELVAAAVQAETADHTSTVMGKYIEGRTRVSSKFDGSCASMYPTVSSARAVLKSSSPRLRSSSSPAVIACEMFVRSR